MSASKILMKRRLLEEAKHKRGAAMAKGEQPPQTGGWPCQKCGYGHEAGTSCPQKQISAARPVSGTEPQNDFKVGLAASDLCRLLAFPDKRGWHWGKFIEILQRHFGNMPAGGTEENAGPPAPEVFARNFLNGNLWLSSDTETEEINAIAVMLRNYAKHILAAAPSLTPRPNAQQIRKLVALIRNMHCYSGINEPSPNFCGKQDCGQYLTHEVHLRMGETEQDAGERLMAQFFSAQEAGQ
jgi:hypothetical protein